MEIRKICLALAFSPRMEAMLAEAIRLVDLFEAQLVLVHVGEKSEDTQERLDALLKHWELLNKQVKILWKQGDPANCILEVCREENIDLLVAGALKKENFMKHYLGTPARKILRKADCSVLMLISPSPQPKPFKNIVVNAEDSPFIEDALRASCYLGVKERANWLHVIREVKLYGLAMSSMDDRNEDEYDEFRSKLVREEIVNVEKVLSTIPHEGLKVNIKLLSGKSGFELLKFVQRKQADLLVVGAPPRKFFLFDRVFTHDLEYIFQNLPSNLLIVNPRKSS
jgi:nucleotide-binding universal stress UspA family protein